MKRERRSLHGPCTWPAAGALTAALLITGCSSGDKTTDPTSTRQPVTSQPASPTTVRDDMDLPHFAPLDPGTYSIDPDGDPATSLRVLYTVPTDGWLMWIGAAKTEPVPNTANRHVGVSIATVTNLVVDGCHDHNPANPPIGATVDDLATALTELAPFQVTSPPRDTTIDGYHGQHLQLTVPDMPYEGRGDNTRFTNCISGELMSWMAPTLTYAFWGYAPRQVEEFWILDVDGNRLVIQANWSPDSPPQDITQMRAILDSIRIER